MDTNPKTATTEDLSRQVPEIPSLAEMSVVEMASYYAGELRAGTGDHSPVDTLDAMVDLLDRREIVPSEASEEVVARLHFADDPGAGEKLLLALLREGYLAEPQLRDLITPDELQKPQPVAVAAESSEKTWSQGVLLVLFFLVFAAGWGSSRLVSNEFLIDDRVPTIITAPTIESEDIGESLTE